MPTTFFDYDSCVTVSDGCVDYTRCVLARPLWPYFAGDIIDLIRIDYHAGTMEFFNKDDDVPCFATNITLSAR